MKLAIVIPTIDGREDELERTLDAYVERTPHGYHPDLRVIRNMPCWPAACNEGTRQALAAGADVIHYGADDLEPAHDDWLAPALDALERGVLPAPRVWNHTYGGAPWSETCDGPPGSRGGFTRVPIVTAELAGRIGDWPEIIYYADCWVSDKARFLGMETEVVGGYDFVHRWSQVGRLDGDGQAMNEAYEQYLRACP